MNKLLLYNMFDIKLLAVACAAFFLVWRVFKRKKHVRTSSRPEPFEGCRWQDVEKEEDLFMKEPHDILLSLFANESVVSAKLRASYTQNAV